MTRARTVSAALAAGLILASAVADAAPRNHLFLVPEDYVGRTVQVCGYVVDGANMLESRWRQSWNRRGGLTISDGSPLPPRFRGHACVQGEINALCGPDQAICSETAFDYEVRISRVLSVQPDPERRR